MDRPDGIEPVSAAENPSAVSVGYFVPADLHPDPAYLCQRLRRNLPAIDRSWPLRVSSIYSDGKGTGVAYALIDGNIAIHIDQVGLADSDGRIFQFVIETSHRPCLLTVPAGITTSNTIFGANGWQGFGLGAIELQAGMAVHFDITKLWHGITQLPLLGAENGGNRTVPTPPRAVIIQVAGFGAHEIGAAVEKAVEIIHLDRAFWERKRR